MAGHILRQSLMVGKVNKCQTKLLPLMNLIIVRTAHKYAQADLEPSRYKGIYRDLHGAIDDTSTAKDFVYALNRRERDLLQAELQRFNLEVKDIPGWNYILTACLNIEKA